MSPAATRNLAALLAMAALCTGQAAHAADEVTIGLHLATAHVPSLAGQNDANLGAYVRTASGITLGAYRNTLRRPSLYLGQTLDAGRFSLTVGVISGYRRREVAVPCADIGRPADFTGCTLWDTRIKATLAPLVAPSMTLPQVAGLTPRLTLLPGVGARKVTALHLSIETPLQ